jgi:hypothetical protein
VGSFFIPYPTKHIQTTALWIPLGVRAGQLPVVAPDSDTHHGRGALVDNHDHDRRADQRSGAVREAGGRLHRLLAAHLMVPLPVEPLHGTMPLARWPHEHTDD